MAGKPFCSAELLVPHKNESLGAVWGEEMRLRTPLSTASPKLGEGTETQTHTSDLPLELYARHRYFDFDKGLFNQISFL